MADFSSLIRRFAKDESGIFAVVFGLMAIVLIALGGAVVDYVSLEQTRARAQAALDAAALALQSEINVAGVTDQSILDRAQALVLERIGDSRVEAEVDRIEINRDQGRLFLGGNFSLPTNFVSLVGVTQLGAAFEAEAVRGSVDIEVSVALDVTASMSTRDIQDLRTSVTDLVNAIVQDVQSPTTSRVALVPYSQAVNAGDFATTLRGPIRPIRPSTRIAWKSVEPRSMTVTSQRNALIRINLNNHGFQNGDWVYVTTVLGTANINNQAFQVVDRNNTSFALSGTTAPLINLNLGGSVTGCLAPRCDAVVTSENHGYAEGDELYFWEARGLVDFNDKLLPISRVTQNSFVLAGAAFNRTATHTPNTGSFFCTWQRATEGCPYFRYTGRDGSIYMNPVTSCVTERAAPNFVSQSPRASFVGRNYPDPENGCLRNTIVPLTSNRTALVNSINALSAAGSTSGSLGILWSWYMLNPDFGYAWPTSQPRPYRAANLLKAAIIMTDGEFNTVHCEGVVARNSTSGSGNTNKHNNCVAPNGDPYAQARTYCDAMKSNGIVVYTVGFNISSGSTASNLLRYCASGDSNFYLASNGTALRDSFRQIARNISVLRLSQ
jgi:Flp pilus assembly protein TadG